MSPSRTTDPSQTADISQTAQRRWLRVALVRTLAFKLIAVVALSVAYHGFFRPAPADVRALFESAAPPPR